jgi:hypothetical protein
MRSSWPQKVPTDEEHHARLMTARIPSHVLSSLTAKVMNPQSGRRPGGEAAESRDEGLPGPSTAAAAPQHEVAVAARADDGDAAILTLTYSREMQARAT